MYTIEYQGITAPDLEQILIEKKVTHLLDVRSKPLSRWKPEFNKPALERRFANSSITYIWEGKTLGGLSEISEDAIKHLAAFDKGRTVCIMCMEKDPAKCHRSYEIGRRISAYGIEIDHLVLCDRNKRNEKGIPLFRIYRLVCAMIAVIVNNGKPTHCSGKAK